MNILISGATGFIGSALTPFLTAGGHKVIPLSRSKEEGRVQWDPMAGQIDTAGLDGLDAVVHLAGESIAQRWTPESKARIRESRAKGTRLLTESLAGLTAPPKVLVCASAIGYYGDRGDEMLQEESGPGADFLAEVAQEWEVAAKPAAEKGIRVVNLRFGIILSPKGGALARMLTPFKMGVGGVIGSGRQYWSWVALDDVIGAVHHALTTESLQGPVNVVSPNPVTNHEFTKVLGRVLGRPTLFPLPAFVTRIALGEMADALLLSSARVEPVKLVASGYRFLYPDLGDALRHLLGKK